MSNERRGLTKEDLGVIEALVMALIGVVAAVVAVVFRVKERKQLVNSSNGKQLHD